MKSITFVLSFFLVFNARSMSPVQDKVAYEMGVTAQKLIKSLSDKQLKKLLQDKKKRWDYLPTFRLGIRKRRAIPLKKLNEGQIKQVWNLLKTGMSLMGMETIKLIRTLEANLKKNPGFARIAVKYDPMLYYVSIYGNPKTRDWAWRFEGHHLTLNFTIKNGRLVTRSPTFMGALPNIVPKTQESGKHGGKPVLENHIKPALQLINDLSPAQRAKAIIKGMERPDEVILGPKETPRTLKPKGIAFTDLSPKQKALYMAIVNSYVLQFRREIAQQDLLRIRKSRKNQLFFLWAGEYVLGKPFYYRLQGPSFILEFDHWHGDPTHTHSVWRDKNEADLLRDHYKKFKH